MDLASLHSVSSAAKDFLATAPPRLDILLCNAGIMASTPCPEHRWLRSPIRDEFSLSHAFLIKHLLPLLLSHRRCTRRTQEQVSLTSTGFTIRTQTPTASSSLTSKTSQDYGIDAQIERDTDKAN